MSLTRKLTLAAVLLALAGCVKVRQPATPGGKPATQPAGPSSGAGDQAAQEVDKDKPFKDWDEVVKDAEVLEGLFRLYQKRGDLYWEIRPDQLESDYLVVVQYERGIGDYLILGGLPLRRDIVQFRRRADQVQLILPNIHAYADPGTPMARAVDLSYGASVLASLKIESVHQSTGAILVNMNDALISDWADVSAFIRVVLGSRGNFDKGRSALSRVRAFPTNVEISVDLTYRYEGERPLPTVPDRRYIPVGIHYSWLELPESPMRPRPADDRIGHYVTARLNFSRDTAETFFVRYAERWRLERADPRAPLSEPVQPIVFYLDRTIPDRWRPYVRQGVENWNVAFEKAGFKNAIVARDAPEDPDWHPEDARYSTIRWITPHRSTFAIGPSDADPRTGEILNADILVTASVVQLWRSDWQQIASPTEAIREYERVAALYERLSPVQAARLCLYAQGMELQAAFVRSVLLARGVLAPGEPVPESFVGAAIVDLTMHEVGHTVGLRHNFRASSATPYDQLNDRRFTSRNGLSGSVMDYNATNVAVDRARQGDYFMEAVGPYDIWAIEYAYSSLPVDGSSERERVALAAIARRGATDAALTYGTDEDALFGPAGIDPLTQRWDLGSDPIRFAADRAALVAEVVPTLEDRVVSDGESYYRLRGAFNGVMIEKWRALLAASKVVGGQYARRFHRGDAGGATPFEPLPADRQREALHFVLEDGFSADAFEFSPSLLNKLTPSRWLSWDENPFIVPVDYPIHEVVLGIQTSILGTTLHPITLTRILDAEVKVVDAKTSFTLAELFHELTRSIWSEVYESTGTGGIGSFRRGIQRRYVEVLTRILLEPAPGTPEDAQALARSYLAELGGHVDAMLDNDGGRGGQLDRYTRAHLEESSALIERTLEASVAIRVGG